MKLFYEETYRFVEKYEKSFFWSLISRHFFPWIGGFELMVLVVFWTMSLIFSLIEIYVTSLFFFWYNLTRLWFLRINHLPKIWYVEMLPFQWKLIGSGWNVLSQLQNSYPERHQPNIKTFAGTIYSYWYYCYIDYNIISSIISLRKELKNMIRKIEKAMK